MAHIEWKCLANFKFMKLHYGMHEQKSKTSGSVYSVFILAHEIWKLLGGMNSRPAVCPVKSIKLFCMAFSWSHLCTNDQQSTNILKKFQCACLKWLYTILRFYIVPNDDVHVNRSECRMKTTTSNKKDGTFLSRFHIFDCVADEIKNTARLECIAFVRGMCMPDIFRNVELMWCHFCCVHQHIVHNTNK